MLKHILFCISLLLFFGCASTKNKQSNTTLKSTLKQISNTHHFTGFVLYDPIANDTLYSHNATKYFTPASNTKIFTLYTAMQLLGDSVPSLKYVTKNDTLFIEGTGDPALLHPYFKDSTAIKFMKKHTNTTLYLNNFDDTKYGPGWSWDDYDCHYSPERSSFPIYGNVLNMFQTDTLSVTPNYFNTDVSIKTSKINRDKYNNTFYYEPDSKDTIQVPFLTSATLTKTLLEKVTGKKISLTMKFPEGEKKTLYGIPTDSLYKRMMYESDNFIAEQLLLMASSTLSDTLKSETTRNYILENQLADLKHKPRWVDGSGLSRYNLFTPTSMVDVLHRLYKETTKDKLFSLFPIEGILFNNEPYIYAKSGSLSNNYCLSGYLITKSGKILIFSYMNNHYRIPAAELKEKMQLVFKAVYDKY